VGRGNGRRVVEKAWDIRVMNTKRALMLSYSLIAFTQTSSTYARCIEISIILKQPSSNRLDLCNLSLTG